MAHPLYWMYLLDRKDCGADGVGAMPCSRLCLPGRGRIVSPRLQSWLYQLGHASLPRLVDHNDHEAQLITLHAALPAV